MKSSEKEEMDKENEKNQLLKEKKHAEEFQILSKEEKKIENKKIEENNPNEMISEPDIKKPKKKFEKKNKKRRITKNIEFGIKSSIRNVKMATTPSDLIVFIIFQKEYFLNIILSLFIF